MGINELYINKKLVVLPNNFSVRLNRQILNPAELNVKDAQFSYAISLPPVDAVHQALGFANIEETRDKFNRLHTATYLVNGVVIFDGLLRLTYIGKEGYKGNLYKPAAKSVKDIFGDINLNEVPELRIPFTDFATSITSINNAARLSPQNAIFPFALYGVLAKVPLNRDANNYSARDLWDETVYIGMADVPPSLNLLKTLRHIFQSQGFNIQGTAFDDEKLARIYMSYKNAPEYVQPWNYGYHAKMQLNGEWSSVENMRNSFVSLEKGINQSFDNSGFVVYSVDMLDAVNSKITVTEDTGGNILYKEIQDGDGNVWAQGQIRIPASGFYKVKLGASIALDARENLVESDPVTGISHISARSSEASNDFGNNSYEIKLLRDRRQTDFGLSNAKIDGRFYYDNLPQNSDFDSENIPKYFPQVSTNQKVLVDLAQNKNILLGFHFGKSAAGGRVDETPFVNPRDSSRLTPMILAAKPAVSWNAQEDTERTLLAVPNVGYWKYGRVNVFGDSEDNPNTNIDYSGGTRIIGKILDDNGNPRDPLPSEIGGKNIFSTATIITDTLINNTGGKASLAGWKIAEISLAVGTTKIFFAGINPRPNGAAVYWRWENASGGLVSFGSFSDGSKKELNRPAGAVKFQIDVVSPAAPENLTDAILAYEWLADTIILSRFPLSRYFTYRVVAGSNISGTVFLHNGADLSPVDGVDYVGGVSEFNTNLFPISVFDPRMTLYLKTPTYNIDGVMTLNRRIDEQSDDTIDWETTNRFRMIVNNAPASYAVRGQYDGAPADAGFSGQGEVSAIIWLEAGELLSVASVAGEGRRRRSAQHSAHGYVAHWAKWSLSVQPFRIDKDWFKVGLNGNGITAMNWADPSNFDTDSINLMGFLSAETKTNDFIENVVKAFNLQLTQLNADTFALNVKQSRTSISSRSIDLDPYASVRDRGNTPLGLPSAYAIGFTVASDEEGYLETGDDGGGQYPTGSVEGDVVEQKSSFSYNWFKEINKDGVSLPLPIISKADVWDAALPYPDAMAKRYTDLAYRFWYFDGLLNDLGAEFEFNGMDVGLAKVSNEIAGVSVLNYKNQPHTILDNYFTLLINGSSHYTEFNAYLTAAQYKQLDGSIFVKFNGDLYYLSEITGYDPTNRNKATLKLIRRI